MFFGAIFNFFIGSFLLIFFSVVFFAVLAVASYFVIGFWVRGNEIQTPDLTTKTLVEAFDLAKQNNLAMILDRQEANPSVPEGKVISQNPRAGSWIKERSPIRVVVSMGTRHLPLPADLVSLPRREAGIRLREMGLGIGNVAFLPVQQGQAEDIVLATDPPPGTGVPPGSNINLLVSSNLVANQFVVPNMIGLTPEDARKELKRAGEAKLKVTQQAKEDVESGQIHKQDPEAGALAAPGVEVTVFVAP